MNKIKSLLRPDLLNITPYSSARDEFSGEARIFLDANENPYGASFRGITGLNRYPDPYQRDLKNRISVMENIRPEKIIIGNGSDEILDLLIRATCIPGESNIIINPPTYGMYAVLATSHNTGVKEVLLDDDFRLRTKAILSSADKFSRIIFICSPNNPTANIADQSAVEELAEKFNGLLIIDEAYIDFSNNKGFMDMIDKYANIFILRTFSKARGLAAARLGIGYGNEEIIRVLNSIKLPYNINSLSIGAAMSVLDKDDVFRDQLRRITESRRMLADGLEKISGVRKVYPSEANFILIKTKETQKLYKYLESRGIIVRDRSGMPLCDGCLRITVGRERENEVLLEEIENFFSGNTNRKASDKKKGLARERRRTGETDVLVDINLYGRGIADIQSGSGFLDHMLELLAFHASIDLLIRVSGDTNVDMHHCMEDIAITLGMSVKKALGNSKGIQRYGYVLPMDESIAAISIDMGGRSMLIYKAEFNSRPGADIPADMYKHFFRSFCDNANCTLHIEASGENDHHILEAIFKGFARALKQAISLSNDEKIQSTKIRNKCN